ELTERLENGVKELYASDSYAQYITAMAKFHHYSFGNALLILFQCPSASNVAGYNTWKQLGRQVKKGEKGIMILAPCSFRASLEREKSDPLPGQTLLGPDGNPLTEKVKIAPNRFKIAHIFDLSQTEGRELPQIGVSELTGDVADYTGIYDRLTAISPLPVVQEDFQRSAKGYTSFAENRVVVKPGMSQVQTIKTLVHEIAHAKLHRPDDILAIPTPGEKRQKEVEAESIAYVVCQHFGIDTSDYSLAYVAGWSRGKELTELKASLNVIHATAGEIIDAISPPPPKLERQLSQAPEKKPKRAKRK
ncbi:MAG: ssDNA-binding domain-containing protein, partial [Oscillospiraceae bacterium]|nr:ssDNA-binding domain-containing protein [Oscillospiraceae bacterium]